MVLPLYSYPEFVQPLGEAPLSGKYTQRGMKDKGRSPKDQRKERTPIYPWDDNLWNMISPACGGDYDYFRLVIMTSIELPAPLTRADSSSRASPAEMNERVVLTSGCFSLGLSLAYSSNPSCMCMRSKDPGMYVDEYLRSPLRHNN